MYWLKTDPVETAAFLWTHARSPSTFFASDNFISSNADHRTFSRSHLAQTAEVSGTRLAGSRPAFTKQ
jgi:hypothetical protein